MPGIDDSPDVTMNATSQPAPQRAVVLGASLAGLLAARVLSEHFSEVVLLERDELPAHAAPRKGTPHAAHPHGLLARGRLVLEDLFPGFTDAMVARGGLLGDLQRDSAFEANRQRFATGVAGLPALGASRLAIEAEVRLRVLALPSVRCITGVDVLAPRVEHGRVVAARCVERDAVRGDMRADSRGDMSGGDRTAATTPLELPAALIVDCTGRGSRLPQWLAEWGYAAPAEERVNIGICYTSAYFKRTGACALGPGLDKVAAFGAVTNEQPRPGVVIAQEPAADGVPRWVVAVGGFAGDHAAATITALRERAADIASPELVKITHEGEMIGDVMRYTMPHSQRRHYEKLARFPAGLLAMGDAITSFNPIYGQGMTVAACEALVLQEQLRLLQAKGLDGLARRYFRAAAKVIDIPWQLAVGGDLSLDKVPGKRPLPVRVVNAYVARIYRVAPHDAEVSATFQKVVHMLQGPQTLFAPRMLWRVLVSGRRAASAATLGQPERAHAAA
jgi:2-polyprenyl-6-methoxyphenol hydroxylase-like FAD-dependent oxidoreductase